MFKVTDANGKEFNVELDYFTHFTTDADIEKNKGFALSDSEKVNISFQTRIVDSQGNKIDIESIVDNKNNDKPITCLDVTFEATHSGRTRNYTIYHSDSMEKDAESWLTPFAKPFIKNHNTSSEPLGRVKNFLFSKSDFNPDRDTINVTYRITDIDAIPKFLDGRYKTMSIGGNVKNITCSICGKTILKDNKVKFCGHWKGETYGDQVCVWNCRDIEYVEGSVVNTPADDWAMVKTIVINPQDSENQDANKENISKDGKDIENMPGTVLDNIDNILNPPVVEDKPAEDNPPVVNDNTEDEDRDAKIQSLTDKITELEAKLAEKDSEITDKDTELISLNDKVTSIEADNMKVKTQLVDMAKLNKELLMQSL
jgi:hypothetical protein